MTTIPAALKKGHELWICGECAEKHGAVWPTNLKDASGNTYDHVATWSEGTCDACGWDKATCAMSDWEWPGKDGRRMREQREI